LQFVLEWVLLADNYYDKFCQTRTRRVDNLTKKSFFFATKKSPQFLIIIIPSK
jgi:hypothetical protein